MDEKEKEKLLKEIEKYTEKIKKDPDNDTYYHNRGNVYANLKDYEKAINDYDEAIKLNPNDDKSYYNKGVICVDLIDFNKAIENFNKAISLNHGNVIFYYSRGITYANLNDNDKAIHDFDKAIRLNPNDDRFYYNKGVIYIKLKNYSEAIEAFSKAITLNPNDAFHYNNRGIAYANLKNFKKAINDFNKAIDLNPNDNEFYDNRGHVYTDSKIFDKAINDYNKAIMLNPNNASHYNNRGIAYMDSKIFDKAIHDFDKAIRLNPNNAHYYNNRGNAYFSLENFDKAIHDYDKAIRLNPNEDKFYYNKGNAYFNLENFDKAISNYNKAIDLNPNNASYYSNKGDAYYFLNNYKEAIENYNKAEELNPNRVLLLKEDALKKLRNSKVSNYNKKTILFKENYQNNFDDALASHLNAKSDTDFKKAEEKFNSFMAKYNKSINKPKFQKEVAELKILLKEAELYEIASKEKVKRLKGYLTFADILGWKGIWQKQNTDDGKINNIKKLLLIKSTLEKEFREEEQLYNINLISDTFVIYTRSFELSNKLSRKLIELCLEKELLIRGATSYGECYNKDMVYIGQAVDEAASWHEKGEEIGIFYTSSAKLSIKEKKLTNKNLKECYLKEGIINTKLRKIRTFFINWYNKKNEKNFYEIMKKEIIYPEFSIKYFNTEENIENYLYKENRKTLGEK